MNKDELLLYLDFAKDLADKAGAIMLQYFKIGVANQTKELEGNTPVTVADTTINSMVIQAIRDKYPTHAVIGEEESNRQEGAALTWICDPIDGTIPYVMGVPTNVFSLAMVNKDGQPVVAVVLDPYMERKYWATKGCGAFMNGQSMHVNGIAKLAQAYVGMSGSRSKTIKPLEFKSALIAAIYRPVILNCAIYEAMLVACGQMAASVYLGFGAHDVATSKLIVEEAGGTVTNVFGDEQRYDQPVKGAIISNGTLHDTLIELAASYKLEA